MAEQSRSSHVLALLDDAGAGIAALEMSSALAHALQRDLAVVYLENTDSLSAAALPFTQVLPHAGSAWLPFAPQDVEQGFRAHASRLRGLAERIALRHKVGWSLRVMRGSLSGVAAMLGEQSDLLLLGAPAPSNAAVASRSRTTLVAVVADGGEAGPRARRIAAQLAQSLGGQVQSCQVDAAGMLAGDPQLPGVLGRADVLVLPHLVLEPGALAALRCPVLLVG